MKILAILITITAMSPIAFAKDVKVVDAEKAMMKACGDEFPKAVSKKKFSDVAKWVEKEERGSNAEKFKASECYKLHEDWEQVAEHHDDVEEHHEKN
jgi:hypothetical protein